ncbi:hypothetical protein EVAR_9750_1 [Eumeta japonica]|uniref:Uncharacterized protein n=1 Tax=Eumeta variegata TaxID=151549 RepID=A0A4C1U5D4_EUMVA|nr:hypothetical protein EVAR_9750_1 [Eumeta japonica]
MVLPIRLQSSVCPAHPQQSPLDVWKCVRTNSSKRIDAFLREWPAICRIGPLSTPPASDTKASNALALLPAFKVKLETSSQHSTMDCVDDENGMSAYMELRIVSPAYMPLRTVTPTPCENSLDDNIQPLVQLDTVLSTPSQEDESLILEEEFENSKSETSMGRRVIDMTYFLNACKKYQHILRCLIVI